MCKIKRSILANNAWGSSLSYRIVQMEVIISPGGGGYSLIWAIWGRAAGQGMVFGLAVLNRVCNLTCLCPKQGMVLRAERL